MAAATPEQEPAQDGDVVIKADEALAVWTTRAWMNDRDPAWQPVDTYIQKAAKRQPECENRQ